jgi:hypothetical protein
LAVSLEPAMSALARVIAGAAPRQKFRLDSWGHMWVPRGRFSIGLIIPEFFQL